MKRTPIVWMTAAVWIAGGATPIPAAAITLKVGDPAPKLQVGKWIQGEPVKEIERGRVYLVEFWATWCGPCRTSIPHLNEIHNKYKDKGLIVIGQDVFERDEAAVPKFVKSMGGKMTYRVALDDKADSERGKMADTWMEAAGQNGIPSAFLVDKQGKIAWIGHPMELKEQVLDQVLAGSFNLEAAARNYARRLENEEQMNTLWRQFNTGMRQKEWADAESALDQMVKLTPEEERDNLEFSRFRLCLAKGDYPAAFKIAKRLSDANLENAMVQNELAWAIATLKNADARDMVLAEKIATRANDAAKGGDAAILDTLARVIFLKGDHSRAIELQQKAVDLAAGAMKESFKKTLASYKDGRVPADRE